MQSKNKLKKLILSFILQYSNYIAQSGFVLEPKLVILNVFASAEFKNDIKNYILVLF